MKYFSVSRPNSFVIDSARKVVKTLRGGSLKERDEAVRVLRGILAQMWKIDPYTFKTFRGKTLDDIINVIKEIDRKSTKDIKREQIRTLVCNTLINYYMLQHRESITK